MPVKTFPLVLNPCACSLAPLTLACAVRLCSCVPSLDDAVVSWFFISVITCPSRIFLPCPVAGTLFFSRQPLPSRFQAQTQTRPLFSGFFFPGCLPRLSVRFLTHPRRFP